MVKFLKFWFPVILYSGIIFYVSGMSKVSLPEGIWALDKLLHVLEYLPFGFLLIRALWTTGLRLDPKRALSWALIGSVIYALSDEIHQMYVPGRSASVFDVIADTIGAFLGVWIYLKFINRRLVDSNDTN